jgi:DUF4097 and DUF4098 domain-containing protein YvlB
MQTFETPEPIALALEVGVGDVRIAASDRTDTVVDVRPGNPAKGSDVSAAEQTSVEFANGRLVVRASKGWRQWTPWSGSGSVEVRIELPSGSTVSAESAVGSLRCGGRLGDCRCRTGAGDIDLDQVGAVEVKTGAGNITVDRAVGKVDVTTGSGAVALAAVDGVAVVRNGNGDVWIGEVTGEARVNGGNGTISIDRAGAGVAAKTANGDVRLGDVSRAAVIAQTGLGTVEVGVREGVAAWLELDTKFGDVQNDLEAAGPPGPDDGTVEVHARTSFGDILIHRAVATGAGAETS